MDEPEACYYLAWIYIYGDEGVGVTEKDPAKGLALMKKSADLGHPPAIEKCVGAPLEGRSTRGRSTGGPLHALHALHALHTGSQI